MNTANILSIDNLSVVFHTTNGDIHAIRDLSLSIGRGEIAAVAGESGCGKSVLCRTIMGLLPKVAEVTGGNIRLAGPGEETAGPEAVRDTAAEGTAAGSGRPAGTEKIRYGPRAGLELIGLSDREYCRIRGRDMAMVFQDPALSLHPGMAVGRQIAEAIRAHDRKITAAQARAQSIALMEEVGIDRAADRYDAPPWMLSGGMRQRCVLAMALSQGPRLLIADEITTALDVTMQAEILDLLLQLRDRHSLSVLFITHDLRACAHVADTVHIMREGRFLESGPASSVLHHPSHAYTKTLLQAAGLEIPVPMSRGLAPMNIDGSAPAGRPTDRPFAHRQREACTPHTPTTSTSTADTSECDSPCGVVGDTVAAPLLQVEHLCRSFPLGQGERVQAVRDVSLQIHPGEVFALAGESGSGKTTLARCILGMLPPDRGQIRYDGLDITGRTTELRRRLSRELQFISQDPGAALDPRMTVRQLIAEPLQIHKVCPSRKDLEARIRSALAEVQMSEDLLDRLPGALSGGQKQRVAIARAYCMDPRLLVADEPTASLDVSIQAQIIRLLLQLQQTHGTALLFISHDLTLVERISDRTGVMYRGQLVEQAPTTRLFAAPQHPYTKRLLAAGIQPFHENTEPADS